MPSALVTSFHLWPSAQLFCHSYSLVFFRMTMEIRPTFCGLLKMPNTHFRAIYCKLLLILVNTQKSVHGYTDKSTLAMFFLKYVLLMFIHYQYKYYTIGTRCQFFSNIDQKKCFPQMHILFPWGSIPKKMFLFLISLAKI